MSTYLLWAIAGFVLVIAELLSGTFYLLVLGIAALAAAFVAYLGADFWVQAMAAAAVALIGIYAVRRWWSKRPKSEAASNNLDLGQAVVIESWVDQAAGTARIKYRGSSWDAQIVAGTSGTNGTNGSSDPSGLARSPTLSDVLYICGQENGVFYIGAKP